MTTKLKLRTQQPRETDEQSTVVAWARMTRLDGIDMLHSIPNGACFAPGYNRFALVAKLKNEGLKDGVSDLFIACARGGHHGLYIEMKKRKGGTESESQVAWRIRAQEEGYKVVVCKGAGEAINEIERYLRYEP